MSAKAMNSIATLMAVDVGAVVVAAVGIAPAGSAEIIV